MLPYLNHNERNSLKERQIRFRTLGCYPQTGAIESNADCVQDIIAEMLVTRQSEKTGTATGSRPGRLMGKEETGRLFLKPDGGKTMIKAKLSEAAKWSDATLIGQDAEFNGIAIDSRRVEPGSLFVAIKGTQLDGHDYIEDAKSRGLVLH